MLRRVAKRHALWVGFLAVLLPLGVLLGLQYVWLVDLQEKSAVAEKAYLWNYLEGVSGKVENFYRGQAERVLNVPPFLFHQPLRDKVALYFAKKKPEGAKLLFAVSFVHDDWGGILVFDPLTELYGEPADVAMARAISVALAPWKTQSYKGSPIQSLGLGIEEKDPDNRIILTPVTDDNSRVLGVAGMIVDSGFFVAEVLPRAIESSLPSSREDLFMTVRDGKGRLVLGSLVEGKKAAEVTGRIPFIFSDWKVAVGMRNATPGEWARSNFLLNVSLSAVLAIVLLGGVTFALRAASREMKLSRMKSDFVSNVSHELRTPLASIRVFGEFLRLGRVRDPEKIREYGEYIETEGRRLTQLIDNILDFSKIESGAKTYQFALGDLELVLAETLRPLQLSLKHKGFDLIYEPRCSAMPPIDMDPDAIAQAVSNLVDNAVKYSGRSTQVRVGLEQSDGEALIAVRDHGIGISPEERARIFERFHRVSTGLVHDVKGSGLGLSIVRHIVAAHGGRVTVESEPGRGSTFTIHLPVRIPASREPARRETEEGGCRAS